MKEKKRVGEEKKELVEKKEAGEDRKELAKKLGIDLRKLEREQEKLAKNLSLKDSIDFSLAERIAGISNVFSGNMIISAVIVINNEFEILEQEYFSDKAKFPYIPGFRAYRELPAMISVLDKLEEKPDVIFVSGHGVLHPRLGLASHFSLVTSIPTIGIAKNLLAGKVERENIFLNNKIVGKVLQTKAGSNPIYISPGNLISLKTAVELTKKFIKEPHKLPEPLYLSHRYAEKCMEELSSPSS